MAHPCVSDPPIVQMGNKDKDSEDTETEEMPQTMDDIDLEEGEIVDSCCETYGDSDKESKKVVGATENNTIHTSEGGEELDMAGRKKKRKKKKKRKDDGLNDQGKPKKKKRYIDHDRVDDEDTWFAINPMPYPKKNFNRISEDGRSPSPSSYDNLLLNAEKKSSPSQDDEEHKPKEEKERRNKKVARKNANRRQNSERGTKKKRKDGSRNGESKKRSLLNKKRKVAKAKSRPLCKFFMEGRCSKGPDCPFSHSSLPSVKKEICKFYLNGYCAKGPKCLYMHGEFPCKFFHTGAKCYSETNCLFSHDPLTDEMRKLLDKYLESSKAEENKKDGSGPEDIGSPPKQQKRPSLLGSPPRHVKEAAETWRWQQHVLQMQQKRYPVPCNAPILSPPHSFSRPNFYMDTLPRSPNKIPSLMSLPPIAMPIGLNAHLPPHLDPPGMFSSIHEGESSSQEEWESNKLSNKEMEPLNDEKPIQAKESLALNSSIKNFENQKDLKDQNSVKNTNDNSNEESSTKLGNSESSDAGNSNQDNQLFMQQSANSPPSETNLPPPTVVIPTHLPRRQRELYLRIQQHQKEAASGDSGTDGGDVSEDPEGKAEDDEKKENWYSSDEDDTEDQPLTAVLKKLREMPPPNRSHQNLGQSFSSNSTIDITKMLSEIRQQASQNIEINGNNISNQQNDFWQNLLGTIPPENAPNCNKPGSRDPRIRPNPGKPPMMNMPDITNKSPPFRDPRLQNRDPRLASRDPRVTPPVMNSNPITPRNLPEKPSPPPWEMRPVVNKPNDVIIENTKSVVNNLQYKLHSITPSQPNYSSYVFQCQSDPKLLNDPRLKKYFKQMSGLLRQQQHMTDNVGPVGSEQSKKNILDVPVKPVMSANDIGNPANMEHWESSKPRITDPRILKSSNLSIRPRQPENMPSSQNMPPESVWTSASINHTPSTTTTTTVTSHLPKSVSDPRLTRLLHPPVDQRWHRSSDQNQSDSNNNSATSQKKSGVTSTSPAAVPLKPKQDSIAKDTSPPSTNNSSKEQSASEDDAEKKENTEKKKTITINRKSNMNYASPLSSYEDNSSNNASYNSYNRRPQASQNQTTKVQPNIPQPVTNTSTASELISQESSGHGQSSLSFLVNEPASEPVLAPEHTPSLKEVFKTKDPTASPFC
ncbi:zinc finger CCCH domain-containing protein 4-like isoform X2 [Centruroides vittatus]|uniref:zinc finger CCCH domain-containing protein 4-like isoform X2 n=1 Tax=Centruroides vittatus TaxID=120091 RepID=UPI00351051E8